jgi:3-hydroxypropanoate dehydrogenase
MANSLPSASLDQLFRSARSYSGWSERTVEEVLVRELYELLKWGPTSANCCPARFVWVRTAEGKAKLAGLASETNRSKIPAAPLTVIIGNDLDFADKLPTLLRLLPAPRIAMMQAHLCEPSVAEVTAMRNGSLQGAYLIMAARALGLDCGPMSGFDNAAVDQAFFAGTHIKSNFICSLGFGKPESLNPRNPRLSFEETSRFE